MRAARCRAPQGQGKRPDQADPPGAVPRRPRHQGRAAPSAIPTVVPRGRQPVPAARAHPRPRPEFRWRSSTSMSMRCAPSCANMRATTSRAIAGALTGKLRQVTDEFLVAREPAPAGRAQGDIRARRWRRASSSEAAIRAVPRVTAVRPRPAAIVGSSSIRSSATSSSQNMRASSRAASAAKRRSSVSSGSISLADFVLAARQHALDHAALEPAARRPARP